MVSTSSAGGPSADGTPSSSVAGGGSLSAVFSYLLSPIADGDPLSTVLGSPLSIVLDYPLSPIAVGGFLSVVSGGDPLPFMPPASSRALFLTSILFYARRFFLPFSSLFYSSLPFSLIPLICNPVLLTRKRLFDQTFIT